MVFGGMIRLAAIHNGCDALKSEMMEFLDGVLPSSMLYTESVDKADVVVFFCCSFTGERENSSEGLIKELQSKGKKVIVSGCFLPRFKKHFPDVKFVHRADLPKYFESAFGITAVSQSSVTDCHDAQDTPIINIASGCLGHCTYCSIKQARGKLVSRPISAILQRINQIENCTKVKLVAQDVSAYGYDIQTSLPALLRGIWEEHPDLHVELGNLNIQFVKGYTASDLELFKYIDGNINLPVQSASNRVLKLMGRDYAVEDFYQLYEKLSDLHCRISTDIIAGFPTENEDDHGTNLAFLKTYYLDFAQIFMFDPRPDTRAAMMTQIDVHMKERRTVELITQFLSTYIGHNQLSIESIEKIQPYNTNIKIQ